MNPLLSKLREERATLKASVDAIMASAADETRDLNDAEDKNLNDSVTRMKELDARIEHLSELELRNAAASELASKVDNATNKGTETRSSAAVVTREESTYRPDTTHSFYRDLYMQTRGDNAATERISRHKVETRNDVVMGDLAGLVPPAYLTNQYVQLARASRVVANFIPKPGAPPAPTFYVPKMATVADVAFQAAEHDTLNEDDFSATNLTVATRTIGGFVDVSRQLLDYGTYPDQEITGQLLRSYSLKIEDMVLNSTTASNKGILQTTGITAVTYTDSTPTLPELYAKVASAVNEIQTNLFASPEIIFMHPTVWNWARSQADSTGRPLISDVVPNNAAGLFGSLAAEGIVGQLYGLPVAVSTLIPKVDEATPTKHQIIVARVSEARLFEGTPVTNVYNEIGASSLSVRFQMHNYVAQCHDRNPKAFSVISGTGTAVSL